jgi:universal stress protein A
MNTLSITRGIEDSKAPVTENGDIPVTAADPLSPNELNLQRIVVAVDFSEHSLKAMRQALAVAARFSSEMILVHIVEQIIYPGDWMYPPLAMSDFAAEKRAQIAERLRLLAAGSGVNTQEVVRLGRAWQEIVEIAKEKKANLVVIATHGYTGLRHVLLGSVAEKVVRHAPCPVLTIRADDRDFA